MLDAYVIEEIKRRDRRRERDDRPVVQLPVPPEDDRPPAKPERDGGDHGVVIIDYD